MTLLMPGAGPAADQDRQLLLRHDFRPSGPGISQPRAAVIAVSSRVRERTAHLGMAVSTRWVTGAAVLAAALGPAIRAAAAPPDLVVKTRTFLPGKDVIAPYGENFIYTPTAPQNGRLVILIPGSSMGRYEDFMTTAAAHGYHVLGLDSPLPPRARTTPARRRRSATAISFDRRSMAT